MGKERRKDLSWRFRYFNIRKIKLVWVKEKKVAIENVIKFEQFVILSSPVEGDGLRMENPADYKMALERPVRAGLLQIMSSLR